MPKEGREATAKLTSWERITIHVMHKAGKEMEEIMNTVKCSRKSYFKWRHNPNAQYKGMRRHTCHHEQYLPATNRKESC